MFLLISTALKSKMFLPPPALKFPPEDCQEKRAHPCRHPRVAPDPSRGTLAKTHTPSKS